MSEPFGNGLKIKRKVVDVGCSKAIILPRIILDHYELAGKTYDKVYVTFDVTTDRIIIEPILK